MLIPCLPVHADLTLMVNASNTMTNVTTSIAVKVTNLPPFEFSWADTKPQKPWSSLIVPLSLTLDGKLLFDEVSR